MPFIELTMLEERPEREASEDEWDPNMYSVFFRVWANRKTHRCAYLIYFFKIKKIPQKPILCLKRGNNKTQKCACL